MTASKTNDSGQRDPQFLYLTTVGRRTGRPHNIEIWFVLNTNNGRYYVMSEGGRKAHWVMNILHNPGVTFQVAEVTFNGLARVVDRDVEPELASKVAEMMDMKYEWDEGLILELKPVESLSSHQASPARRS